MHFISLTESHSIQCGKTPRCLHCSAPYFSPFHRQCFFKMSQLTHLSNDSFSQTHHGRTLPLSEASSNNMKVGFLAHPKSINKLQWSADSTSLFPTFLQQNKKYLEKIIGEHETFTRFSLAHLPHKCQEKENTFYVVLLFKITAQNYHGQSTFPMPSFLS